MYLEVYIRIAIRIVSISKFFDELDILYSFYILLILHISHHAVPRTHFSGTFVIVNVDLNEKEVKINVTTTAEKYFASKMEISI